MALDQMALHSTNPWVLDTGATSHMASSDDILLTRLPHSSSITVGNGHSIHVVSRGTSILPTANTSFHLNNILVAPNIVRIFFLFVNLHVIIIVLSNLMHLVFC
jgi:hypothetical protein